MTQYINKDTLVAEIEKRIKKLQDLFKENEKKLDSFQKIAIHLCIDECKVVLNILNNLKVKKVDFEKELDMIIDSLNDDKYEHLSIHQQLSHIAKYFFELGLKAQKGE